MNEHQQRIRLNGRISNAKNNLPYAFIPVGKVIPTRTSSKDLGMESDSLYTGYMNCTIHALNEICLGNQHEKFIIEVPDLEKPGSKKKVDCTCIKPLQVKGKFLISSSTLKGCISNFLAAYLGYPISRMNQKHYSFRPNNSFGNQIEQAAGIIDSINEDGSITVKKFNATKFAFHYRVINDGIYTYEARDRKYQIRESASSDTKNQGYFYCYPYVDGIDGNATLAKKFANGGRLASHKCLGVLKTTQEQFTATIYTIDSQTHDQYKKTMEVLGDDKYGHLSNHPLLDKQDPDLERIKKNTDALKILKEGDIVFFEHYKNDTKVITFGRHFRYRWAYKQALRDFQEDYQEKDLDALKDGLVNTIEEMFGFICDDQEIPHDFRAKSGKVHFSYAEHIEGTGRIKREKWLPRPGEPKPSSFEFYLKQDLSEENEGEPLTTYGDPARPRDSMARLSGWKFYYRTSRTAFDDKQGNTDAKTVKLVDVLLPDGKSFPQFKFRVHYENLTENELTLLHFALNLNQNIVPSTEKPVSNQKLLCHQIGYGKNYGMGAAKITIDCNSKGEEDIFCLKPKDSGMKLYRVSKPKSLDIDGSFSRILMLRDSKKCYPCGQDGLTYSWHTRLKNEDLANRRNTKRIK